MGCLSMSYTTNFSPLVTRRSKAITISITLYDAVTSPEQAQSGEGRLGSKGICTPLGALVPVKKRMQGASAR